MRKNSIPQQFNLIHNNSKAIEICPAAPTMKKVDKNQSLFFMLCLNNDEAKITNMEFLYFKRLYILLIDQIKPFYYFWPICSF